jgi:hypothetical protein
MPSRLALAAVALVAAASLAGCATSARQLMPTPTLYQQPGGQPVFELPKEARRNPDLDLLFITDRAPQSAAEAEVSGPLPYGQGRARRIAFGSAQVRVVPGLDWETLREQSQLEKRTREVNLELGPVRELGVFPEEPYLLHKGENGKLFRDRAELARHARQPLRPQAQEADYAE